MQFRDEGYLPDALLNYLVRLGWSHGDQEIFSLEELVEKFELTDVNRAASVFDFEKLTWLNASYIQTEPVSELAPVLGEQLAAALERARERLEACERDGERAREELADIENRLGAARRMVEAFEHETSAGSDG